MTNLHKRKYTVDMGWQTLFKDLGLSVQDVLRRAQLPLDLLAQKQPTVTADEYFDLWNGLARVLDNEPTFPLRLVRAVTVEFFSPPIFAALCSANLNVALKRIATYKPLVGPSHLELLQNEHQTGATFRGMPENRPMPSSLVAFELALWVQIARIATREHIIPQAVSTTAALPAVADYEAFFGCAVQQGDANTVVFSVQDANKPFLTASDGMWSIFEPELKKRLEDLTHEASFRERVRACLLEILASGQYSIADVASRFAMSSRTLQRRLQQENTSFQQVLDELREELARHYLAKSDYSTGQIAFLLGYEEPNSFFRAFRSWTGQTPDYIRANLQ